MLSPNEAVRMVDEDAMKKLLWVIVPVLSFAGPASAEVAIKGTLAAKGTCFRGVTSVPFQARIQDDRSVTGAWTMAGQDASFTGTGSADGFEAVRIGRTGESQTVSVKKSGDGYDVVVLGGGPAGIAAAASAAMHGRKTLLIERYGFLGGMGTAAGVTNFCGLHANVHGEIRQVVHGIADELLARIDRLGGLNTPHVVFGKIAAQAYDTAAYKCAADDLLLNHGTDILFHALGAGVVMDSDGTIRALIVETKSGRAAVIGRVFIDCSGDGDLAAWAGAPFERGDGADGMLYPTMMFRVNGVDPAAAGEAWKTIPALMDAAEKRGTKFPRKGAIVRPMKNPIEWRVNVTQMKRADGAAIDGTDADELTAGEIEGDADQVDVVGIGARHRDPRATP